MTVCERRNEITKIIVRRRRETIANIALELGTSKRTIQRDIDAISRLIPIYTISGRNGGIYLCDTYRGDRIYMNSAELQVLNKLIDIAETHPHIIEQREKMVLRSVINNYTRPARKEAR